ncbi:GMP synthase subunit A [Acidianus brierleyi]|uniref:GMP synthase [glutamine-hydrolyzing] subunit A n=1 Tax=Acidianus brierleyi TaxID=41673 RepID=A0A2U9IDL9_9CREN|nr:GMP synthase subunit A [Acidianus brierleyi]AWR94143.1 GMP synthase subunit A [Acidianus brierleyi]
MKIALIYYGGQYNHLILKNLKYLGQDAEAVNPSTSLDNMKKYDCIVFSGGPYSVEQEISKMGNSSLFIKELKIPMLGICLGHQLIAYVLGGKVGKAENPEFGLARIKIEDHDTILQNIPKEFVAWESHNDEVKAQPEGFRVLAYSENAKIQAMVNKDNSIFSVQFHPEVKNTEYGLEVFKNFIKVCKK